MGYLEDKNEERKQTIISLPIVLFLLYLAATTFIQALNNPELTHTQLLKKIPQSIQLNFE